MSPIQARTTSASLVAVVLSLLSVVACQGERTTAPNPTASGLHVEPHQLTLAFPGDAAALLATARDARGAVLPNATVFWRSLDPAVATVSSDGVARAEDGAGQARLVAVSGAVADTVVVDVAFAPRPVWRFSIMGAMLRPASGGRSLAELTQLFRRQVDTLNSRFNAAGAFDGYFHYVLDSVYVSDLLREDEINAPHPGTDYKIVYDTAGTIRPGYFKALDGDGPPQVVVQTGGPDSAFTPFQDDGIVHEFGHARGAVDLYFNGIAAERNPVNGLPHLIPSAIMNEATRTRVWDDYSRYIINRNGNGRPATSGYHVWEYPSSFGVRVVDASGQPAAGVTVRMHELVSYAVTATPAITGTTDAAGELHLAGNPFAVVRSDGSVLLTHQAYLVVADPAPASAYAWVTFMDAQLAAARNPGDPFWITLRLP